MYFIVHDYDDIAFVLRYTDSPGPCVNKVINEEGERERIIRIFFTSSVPRS